MADDVVRIPLGREEGSPSRPFRKTHHTLPVKGEPAKLVAQRLNNQAPTVSPAVGLGRPASQTRAATHCLVVFAKNSIGHKERIIHASVEGPKDLLNGRPLHI